MDRETYLGLWNHYKGLPDTVLVPLMKTAAGPLRKMLRKIYEGRFSYIKTTRMMATEWLELCSTWRGIMMRDPFRPLPASKVLKDGWKRAYIEAREARYWMQKLP